jgi:hypothetical protein
LKINVQDHEQPTVAQVWDADGIPDKFMESFRTDVEDVVFSPWRIEQVSREHQEPNTRSLKYEVYKRIPVKLVQLASPVESVNVEEGQPKH